MYTSCSYHLSERINRHYAYFKTISFLILERGHRFVCYKDTQKDDDTIKIEENEEKKNLSEIADRN